MSNPHLTNIQINSEKGGEKGEFILLGFMVMDSLVIGKKGATFHNEMHHGMIGLHEGVNYCGTAQILSIIETYKLPDIN